MSSDALWEDAGSVFRPSYSSTWINCAGSLLPSRYARNTAGIDAAIGTIFHELIAGWQLSGHPVYRLGEILIVDSEDKTQQFEVEVDEDMIYQADRCLKYYGNIPGDRFVEVKVDISDITPIPNQKGTADLVICHAGTLVVIDWKYGRGVQVWAEKNTQELLYAWGAFLEYDGMYQFENIELHIAQPRLNHFDVWRITVRELKEWADWMRERAHAAWQRGAPRTVSSKACQWCKVNATCPAMELARQNLADMTFDAIGEPVTEADMKALIVQPKELPDPLVLSTEQIARIINYQKMFEDWFKRAREELTSRTLAGEHAPGWKIVEGRSRRRYKDEAEAAEKLGLVLPEDQVFQRKLVSPAQAEKLLRPIGISGALLKSYMAVLVEKPPGKPTLAPDADNRLAIPDAADVFEADDDEAAL